MGGTLVEIPIEEQKSRELLAPLLSGVPVILSVTDPKLHKKKRVAMPTLFITPIRVYGIDDDRLLISMPGYGSEIVDPRNGSAMPLFRIGLNMRASRILSKELKVLFEQITNSGGIVDGNA